MMIKSSMALVLAMIMFLCLPKTIFGDISYLQILFNIVIGFLFGFLLSIPFYLIEMNGLLLDNLRNETAGAGLSNSIVRRKTSMYNFLNICFVTYFINSNGLLLLVKIIFQSFALYPITGGFPDLHLEPVVGLIKQLIIWFGISSFPIMMLSLMIDITFAFSAAVVPSLNVFFLAMPVKSMVLLFLYLLLLPALFTYMMNQFNFIIGQL